MAASGSKAHENSDYAANYLDTYEFERVMVHYRQRFVSQRLNHHSSMHIVEIGCGAELQSLAYQEAGGKWDSWTIVEPSSRFAEIARKGCSGSVVVIDGTFEDSASRIGRLLTPDMIICSSLLHEVADPQALLKAIASVMGPRTVLHVNVPNAHSMHRRLGVAMRAVKTVHDRSQRNELLKQPRVYDCGMLENELGAAGLRITASGGYFVKPFSHDQMARLEDFLDRDLLDGLDTLGREHPEWASEIYCEAVKDP